MIDTYKSILFKNLLRETPALIVIAIAIILIIMVVQDIKAMKKGESQRKAISIFKVIVLSLFSIVLILAFTFDTGIIMSRMCADYISGEFETYEGEITGGADGEGIAKITITVDGNTYYLPSADEQILYDNYGQHCRVTYGKQSRFIVEYSIIRQD